MIQRLMSMILATLVLLPWSTAGLAQTPYYAGKTITIVAGTKAGDERTVKLTFPDDYGAAELAGQDAEFAVTVKEVKAKELPELNDDLAETEHHADKGVRRYLDVTPELMTLLGFHLAEGSCSDRAGIRLSIGARSGVIRRQFLVESITISVAGGLVGIALGVVSSVVISTALGWPTLVSVPAIAGSVVFSVLVGVVFGYYPARKAASLDPIDALRYE